MKEFRESGGPPPICNGTNGNVGIDCRLGAGPPRNPKLGKEGMKSEDVTPAKPTPAPGQEAPKAAKALAQEDPEEEKEPSNADKKATKDAAQPPLQDGFYHNKNSIRTGLAPGAMRRNHNVKGTSSLAQHHYETRSFAPGGFLMGGPVGEDGFYNNPNYKRTGGEAGSQSDSTNVRGTSSFAQAPPLKGTKNEIQDYIKPCVKDYEGNDCVKTGGKYWEHDNDVPLHGVSSLSQYPDWTARDDSKETKRIAACLKTPQGEDC